MAFNQLNSLNDRGVPIIGSADILASDMAFFYQYWYHCKTIGSTDIATDVCKKNKYTGFLGYPCGCLVAMAYCLLYMLREAMKYMRFECLLQESYDY